MSYKNQTYIRAENLKGHTCDGFIEFQKNGHDTCTPYINDKLMIEGCDNTNDLPIKFCPFCGERIVEE